MELDPELKTLLHAIVDAQLKLAERIGRMEDAMDEGFSRTQDALELMTKCMVQANGMFSEGLPRTNSALERMSGSFGRLDDSLRDMCSLLEKLNQSLAESGKRKEITKRFLPSA